MNNKLFAGFVSLVLVSIPTVASTKATTAIMQPQQNAIPNQTWVQPIARNLTPFQLVNFAYDGQLQAQGIPGYGQLENEYSQNRVDAQNIVDAAAKAGLIPAHTTSDKVYVNAVRSQLQSLNPDRNSVGL